MQALNNGVHYITVAYNPSLAHLIVKIMNVDESAKDIS